SRVIPKNAEYKLVRRFSIGWGSVDDALKAGPANHAQMIDKPAEAWRQIDAVLITDDLDYVPVAREKPPFAYFAAMRLRPANGAAWRGSAADLKPAGSSQRPKLAGRAFSMWTGVAADAKGWEQQNPDVLT